MRGPGGTALPALGGVGGALFFLEGKMPLPLFGSLKPCLQARAVVLRGAGMLAVARMSHYFGLLAAFQGQCQSCWGSGDATTGEGPDVPQG